MQQSIGRFLIIVTVATVALAAIACGGGAASEPPGNKSDTPSTPTLSLADEPAYAEAEAAATASEKAETGQPITKKEAATFVEGFMQIYFGGDAEDLPAYLSSTCSQEDIDTMVLGATLLSGLVGAAASNTEIDVIVDPDKLAVDIIANDRAAIVASWSEGAMTFTADGHPMPEDEFGDDTDVPLEVVREDGRWVTTECLGMAQDFFADLLNES